jgi:DNA-binding NarL/FixJ family response regulator
MSEKQSPNSRVGSRRDGERPPAPAPGAGIFSHQAWREIARSLKLSGRELQIVRGVFDDHTDLGIAAELSISRHTVHTHFKRLHRKLGAVSRAQLVLRITQEFLALTTSPASPLPPLCGAAGRRPCPLRR